MDIYSTLLNILDRIRDEAPSAYNNYKPNPAEIEKVNQARGRAYIHLFLKATWGILDFKTREDHVTDGPQDGGIDGYYIDQNSQTIYFIQSKFRTTETNFRQKEIEIEEILKMDTSRVLSGETTHENGVPYNAKILEMQEIIRGIPNIGRYKYEIVILANLGKIAQSKLRLLTSGLPCQIYDYQRTLSDLVFPVINGTFCYYSDMNISVNLSNKSASAKTSYSVETELGACDITVLFVPLIEIGKLMYAYKNSILKFNPRSFLALKEGSINDEIRQTVLTKDTNEFALFNNGITILSDETFFNERIGQKDKAQLSLKNPQIINGGQTAFTLSLVYEDSLGKEPSYKSKLEGKEVLVKVITFSLSDEISIERKLTLIEAISETTNKQNEVNNADRSSNNPLFVDAQKTLFADFGLLLERKRGEFYDGLRHGYIEKKYLVGRSEFMRIALASLGIQNSTKEQKKLLSPSKLALVFNDKSNYKKYYFGCLCYGDILEWEEPRDIGQAKNAAIFAAISLCSAMYYDENLSNEELKSLARKSVDDILNKWSGFETYVIDQFHNSQYFKFIFTYRTQSNNVSTNFDAYYKSNCLPIDLNDFFFAGKTVFPEGSVRSKISSVEKYLRNRHLSPEIIKNIQPLINPKYWFDDETVKSISNLLSIDLKLVNISIALITSKDIGYYLSKYYK